MKHNEVMTFVGGFCLGAMVGMLIVLVLWVVVGR